MPQGSQAPTRAQARLESERNEPVALIDMDGTVADYEKAMRAALDDVLQDHDRIRHPISNATLEKVKLLIRRQPRFWLDIDPIPLGLRIAAELELLGFRLMVLTKGPVRSTNAWTEKVQWCARWLPSAEVTVTHDKGLVYGRLLVDDYPDYILRWLEWRPRGLVLMPRNAWNAYFRHPKVHMVGNEDDLVHLRPLLKRRLSD